MKKLSTHVLDTTLGKPAENVKIELFKLEDENKKLLKTVFTNSDGRVNEPILKDEELEKATYEFVFYTASYFKENGIKSTFLEDVVIRFSVDLKEDNYHVPLLLSPYGYSTYKGS